ncbi:MAG: hypothetical protein M3139_10380 [Bacteroidota bacterium]|nr:hypothetical protein [Bacteroidota bacterium]
MNNPRQNVTSKDKNGHWKTILMNHVVKKMKPKAGNGNKESFAITRDLETYLRAYLSCICEGF